jgi:hypothetical protein
VADDPPTDSPDTHFSRSSRKVPIKKVPVNRALTIFSKYLS